MEDRFAALINYIHQIDYSFFYNLSISPSPELFTVLEIKAEKITTIVFEKCGLSVLSQMPDNGLTLHWCFTAASVYAPIKRNFSLRPAGKREVGLSDVHK